MTIKDLAEVLSIPQSKIKKLCLDLLGCIPAELSQEDESKIRMAIASTTQALAAATEATNEIVTASPENLTPTQSKVAEALGESVVKRLVTEYLKALTDEFKAQKFGIDSLQFEAEQRFYAQLSSYQQSTQNESLARIRKNSNYFSLEGLKSLPVNSSDDDLLSQISSFMECFDYEQG
jgi:hypothetical protein